MKFYKMPKLEKEYTFIFQERRRKSMIVEITNDDMDLFNYESDQIRRQQCKIFQDLWGVNVVFSYSKEIRESIARGAKIYEERHQEPIDPIGHYEDRGGDRT